MDVTWIDSVAAKAVAGVVASLASLITIHHVYLHLTHFQNTKLQRLVCRILLMVPIFSLASFLPLVLGEKVIVVESIKGCYEAFLIYTFLAYIVALLGDESDIVAKIHESGQEEVSGSVLNYLGVILLLGGPGAIAYPLYGSIFPPWEIDGRFLQVCKRGTMQFVFLKPILAVVEIVAFYTHILHHGNLSPKYLYFYMVVAANVIYGTALFYLVLFFTATKGALRQYNPWLKFAVVKGLVFVTFWQGVSIAVLVQLGVITSSNHEDLDSGDLAAELQYFLTCLEMLLFAIAHRFAFPYNEHTTFQLDTHLHDMGIEKSNPENGLPESHTVNELISSGVASSVSILSNLMTVLSVRDLYEDTARNFSMRYHGLTKVASDVEDYEPELLTVGSESSMMSDDEDSNDAPKFRLD